jgi:hypothetical protein
MGAPHIGQAGADAAAVVVVDKVRDFVMQINFRCMQTLSQHTSKCINFRVQDVELPNWRMALPKGAPSSIQALLSWCPPSLFCSSFLSAIEPFLLRFFRYGVLATFVCRPSPHLQSLLSAAAAPPSPCVGVHMRAGHKWVEVNAFDADEYAKATRQLSHACGSNRRGADSSNNIWVATEDGRQLAELQQLLRSQQLLVNFTNNSRPNWRMSIPLAVTAGITSARAENEVAWVNLLLLSKCKQLVLTSSSGFGKRALELMAGVQGQLPSHASLDFPWSGP